MRVLGSGMTQLGEVFILMHFGMPLWKACICVGLVNVGEGIYQAARA